jgi:biotin carboxylase
VRDSVIEVLGPIEPLGIAALGWVLPDRVALPETLSELTPELLAKLENQTTRGDIAEAIKKLADLVDENGLAVVDFVYEP